MDSAADFEDEMLALNPEYDLIFSKYNEACSRKSPPSFESHKRYSPNKMKIISKMNEIIGQKPIGELPTHSDWDEEESVEKETIALMRKFGLQQSIDRPPDSQRTISTIPTTDDVIVMRNGRKKMSIFMSESFFELKPRSEPSFSLDNDADSNDESNRSTSELTEESDLSSKTSSESISSASSTASCGLAPESNLEYQHFSPNTSSVSSKTQSELRSWRRSSTSAESSEPCTYQPANSPKAWGYNKRNPSTNGITNWRSGSSKSAETEKSKGSGYGTNAARGKSLKKEPKMGNDAGEVENYAKVEQKVIPKVVKEQENPAVTAGMPKIVPEAISQCGSPLYKPKDLFLKKKAMLIQQVLSANQS